MNPIMVYTRMAKKNHRFFEVKRVSLDSCPGIWGRQTSY